MALGPGSPLDCHPQTPPQGTVQSIGLKLGVAEPHAELLGLAPQELQGFPASGECLEDHPS